ncbi:MAG: molybdenum cofactor guanylyltransferase [Leptospiraceae bacterium]|nr:molybdenum cofactor guanylyltransferase [Leptospiraceae bacterium]MCB1315562.1 molybdenum cofactor guanylyltransferase [Leptospiraceae bacterium]MCB1322010.1 molybdenum cofactor guanylyltransferase [Leptospiraceae bacterium]
MSANVHKTPLGLVLCGGMSTRMGSDKGLLRGADGRLWALALTELLEQYVSDVCISIRPEQASAYRTHFPDECLIQDRPIAAGPMRGLLSAYERFPERDLLVVACDQQLLDQSILSMLMQSYAEQTRAPALAFFDSHGWQPLCAIYRASFFVELKSKPVSLDKAGHSLRRLLSIVPAFPIEIPSQLETSLRGFNSPLTIE